MVGGGVVASSEDDETDESKEFWPFWKLALIALPQLGVQILWVFLGPNTTSYLISLGASDSMAAINNSAGPVVGFIVGPIVGTWSDQSTSKWGRRRPVIVAGFLATLVAGILYSGARQILGEGSGALWLAASMQWVMDFTINAMQTPFRALVSDLSSKDQQMPMQMFFVVVCAVGGGLAFYINGITDKPTEHMLELTSFVLFINAIGVGVMLAVAREVPFVPQDRKKKKSACDPIMGMCDAVKGRPNVFYLLIFVQCCVWLGNAFWGMYGKEYFTKSVYEGNQTAPEGTYGYEQYVAGNEEFSHTGVMGSALNLALGFVFMWLGSTSIPSHFYYAPAILAGALVCFMSALVVHHNHKLAGFAFVLSQVPLTAAGSIPYGIVAVWNKAEEQMTGKVGSVALQMAILNCCITVGQQACTVIESALLASGQTMPVALKNLLLISMVANTIGGICTLFLGGGPQPIDSTQEASESEQSSDDQS